MDLPPPIWKPSPTDIERANINSLMHQTGCTTVEALHAWTLAHRAQFWQIAATRLGIQFKQRAQSILDESGRWFPGAWLNIVESCFLAADQSTAIVHNSPGGISRVRYGELRAQVLQVAGALRAAGFKPGDAIAVVMPMTVDSVMIYLGLILAGCVVVSIADSFSAPEIATRLHIAGAKAAFTMDCATRAGKRVSFYDRVVEAGCERCIVLPGGSDEPKLARDVDLSWKGFLSRGDECDPHIGGADDAINILFSSGTTGDPKAIPWTHITPIKCAVDGHYHQDIRPGDVVAWPTNLGWMMGPWLIFASLINRATIALHDDVPTDRAFGQFVQDAKVTMLGLVPSIVRRWRETGCMNWLDWSAIRCFSSTGECSNAGDMTWLSQLAGGKPIIEYCGGTEIGGGFVTSTVVQPNVAGAFSTAALGSELVLIGDDEKPGQAGELFLLPPSVGLSTRLLNRDHDEVYFRDCPVGASGKPLRRHGDQFERLPGGYYRALGRADDTMNLGGIKVSSAELERAVEGTRGVKETAAIAATPPGGGPSNLVYFVVPSSGETLDPSDTRLRLQNAIRRNLNPLFRVHDVRIVESLPRTASQKVMRRELRREYEATQTGRT